MSSSSCLYFILGNTKYLPGDFINISDIGPQPLHDRPNAASTLVCVTSNVNTACCRSRDNNLNSSIGNWYYPNGDIINNFNAARGENFTEYVYQQQLRLASQGTPEGPLGEYRCEIPDGRGGYANASINIINILSGNLNIF